MALYAEFLSKPVVTLVGLERGKYAFDMAAYDSGGPDGARETDRVSQEAIQKGWSNEGQTALWKDGSYHYARNDIPGRIRVLDEHFRREATLYRVTELHGNRR